MQRTIIKVVALSLLSSFYWHSLHCAQAAALPRISSQANFNHTEPLTPAAPPSSAHPQNEKEPEIFDFYGQDPFGESLLPAEYLGSLIVAAKPRQHRRSSSTPALATSPTDKSESSK